MSYTILSGKIYIWAQGWEELQLAHQLQSVKLANDALAAKRLTVVRGETSSKLIGLAMGKGHQPQTPVKLQLPYSGSPLFSCPMVCTTGRVEGLPGQLGYFGANASRLRSRSWIFSVNKPLSEWRRALRLPEVRDVRDGVFRLTTSGNKTQVRTQIYREIRDGGKFR